MDKIGSFINYFLIMIDKILKAVSIVDPDSAMLDDIGAAVEEFGSNVKDLNG